MICNHPSFLDPYLLSAVSPRQIHWVAAAFMSDFPLVGRWSSSLGILPLIRASKGRSPFLIDDIVRALKAGRLVGIFPEGMDWMRDTASPLTPAEFHETFVRGILQAQIPFLPIIPVAILPVRTRWRHSVPAQVFKFLDSQEPAFQSGTLDIVLYRDVVIRVGHPTTWDAFYPEFHRCVAQRDEQGQTTLVRRLALQSRAKVEALLVCSQHQAPSGANPEPPPDPAPYPYLIARRQRWPSRRP